MTQHSIEPNFADGIDDPEIAGLWPEVRKSLARDVANGKAATVPEAFAKRKAAGKIDQRCYAPSTVPASTDGLRIDGDETPHENGSGPAVQAERDGNLNIDAPAPQAAAQPVPAKMSRKERFAAAIGSLPPPPLPEDHVPDRDPVIDGPPDGPPARFQERLRDIGAGDTPPAKPDDQEEQRRLDRIFAGDNPHWKGPTPGGVDYRQADNAAGHGDPRGDYPLVGAPAAVPVRPLDSIDISELHGKPIPPREWHVDGWMPARDVTLLVGDGGLGKSTAALQLAVATVSGRDFLGMKVMHGPVLVIEAEDEVDEVHRRSVKISDHYDLSLADLKGLRVVSLAGEDAVLAAPNGRTNAIEATPRWHQLVALIEDHRPRLLVLAALSDFFGGDEIKRVQARQFIKLLKGLCLKYDLSVLLVAHPSLAGMQNGTGSSGSTGWNNSARGRIYMTHPDAAADPDLRLFKTTKANYGPLGGELRARWHAGAFIREPGQGSGRHLDHLAVERAAEDAFMACLRLSAGQGQSFTANPSSRSGAPHNFSMMKPTSAGFGKDALALAMHRLVMADKIEFRPFGPPSKGLLHVFEKLPKAED